MQPELQAVREHVDSCRVCQKANKRVNDFCPEGKVLFYQYAATDYPTSVEVLSEAESAKIINEVEKKRREAHNN